MKALYQAAQLRTRSARLILVRLENRMRFDPALLDQLVTAREALQRAEEISAVRLSEREAA